MPDTDTNFQILSLDGGGSRGIFIAAILANLEQDLKIRITDHFDLIAGTSTGGLIAIALGLGYSPAEIVRFYLDHSPAIFKKYWHTIFRDVLRPRYKADNLEVSLKNQLGTKLFGDSHKRLVVPAFDLDEMKVHIFKTAHHERFRRDYLIEAWKVARSTSAAPTYFPAYVNDNHEALIDGGVWANNPVMVAITEAVSVLNRPLDSLKVFSLGTTDEIAGKDRKALRNGGWWQWKHDAIQVLMKGQAEGVSNQAKLLLGDRMLRLNPLAPEGIYQLDSDELERFMARASHYSRELSPKFRELFVDHIADEFQPIYSSE